MFFQIPATVRLCEIINLDPPVIDERNHDGVRNNGTEFLHQIEGEARFAILELVKETDVRI